MYNYSYNNNMAIAFYLVVNEVLDQAIGWLLFYPADISLI